MSIVDLPSLVRARLANNATVRTSLRQMGGAADLASAQRTTKALPAVFVVPLAETTDEPLTAGTYRQTKTLQIGIVIAASDASDGAGSRAQRVGIMPVRALIEDALIGETGWMPPGCSDVMAWAGGKLARIDDNGVIWWQDDYVTRQIVATPT